MALQSGILQPDILESSAVIIIAAVLDFATTRPKKDVAVEHQTSIPCV